MLLVIAGCSGGEQAMTRVPEPPASVVRLPLLPSGGPHHLVGATGVLEVDGPCLYLRAANGVRTLPAFATPDTRWNPSGWLEVGQRKFRPGQTVRLGGSPAGALLPKLPWVQAPDPRCDASNAFIAHQIVAGP